MHQRVPARSPVRASGRFANNSINNNNATGASVCKSIEIKFTLTIYLHPQVFTVFGTSHTGSKNAERREGALWNVVRYGLL